jgi:hypothetical protein
MDSDISALFGVIFIIAFAVFVSVILTANKVATDNYNTVYTSAHTLCINKADLNTCNQDIIILKKIAPDDPTQDIEVLRLQEQSAK